MGSTITSVHGVSTIDLLDAMMEDPEKAGLSSGVRYVAADQKGKVHNSASELAKLAQDWLLFFPWLSAAQGRALKFKEPSALHNRESPLLLSLFLKSLLTLFAQRRECPNSGICERNSDQCAVTGALSMLKGPYPPDTEAATSKLLTSSKHPLFTSIPGATRPADMSAAHCGNDRHNQALYQVPEKIMDDLACIIDNPENVTLLDSYMHRGFNTYTWENFTEVQFQDHSQTGIPLPNPTFIALHSAVAHVLHLSGTAKVIDKVYDAVWKSC
ncbi:hypothetical protein EDD22DRAFT_847930 [Suillus occidentalis]|nr:hypothetical protein EDD22DRAFT_847930 [Suillus occidentalis]